MKILIFGDNHWSQYSSIVRKRGSKYSLRLENQINSVNWAEELAVECGCDFVVCLGDFFDKAELNAEELTALKDIKWGDIPHFFLVGNHEMGLNDLSYSSAHLFALNDRQIVDKPISYVYEGFGDKVELCFLPYVLECDRKPLKEYFEPKSTRRVIFSHNDIKGIQMGRFESTEGFEIEDIENNCDLFINGHLHNGTKVTNKIINCGNLTGQNFGEDAMHYDHIALVLDTDTLKCEVYENPYAFNFYKIDVTKWAELGELRVKSNAVCTVQCRQIDVETVKQWIASNPNIIESRIVAQQDIAVVEDKMVETFAVDHLKQFYDYIIGHLENTEVLVSELEKISK